MGKAHWLALTGIRGLGGVTLRRLLERFGTVEGVLDAPADALLRVPRITLPMVALIKALPLAEREAELGRLAGEGVRALIWEDADYPANLLALADAPPVLFVRGRLLPADRQAVAIVGTRRPSPENCQWTQDLARELAGQGVTVVSGLALGIDTAAHQGALQAENGRTLAVPGSGLLALHPRENLALAESIVSRGALLSELRPTTVARGAVLMARNRILIGLSRAAIVVEAGERSGSLHAAGRARQQGRPLFAVPGSAGTHALIHLGAERLDPQNGGLNQLCQRVIAAVQNNPRR